MKIFVSLFLFVSSSAFAASSCGTLSSTAQIAKFFDQACPSLLQAIAQVEQQAQIDCNTSNLENGTASTASGLIAVTGQYSCSANTNLSFEMGSETDSSGVTKLTVQSIELE